MFVRPSQFNAANAVRIDLERESVKGGKAE